MKIAHPNIVQLFGVYKWKNRDFLVLEFMYGG
jgi:serine/threonine protein kinase